MAAAAEPVVITVTGRFDDPEFSKCKVIAKAAEDCGGASVKVTGKFETDWLEDNGAALIVVGGTAVTGGVDAFVTAVKGAFPAAAIPDLSEGFEVKAKEAFLEALVATGNSFAYHDIKVGEFKAKRVFYELYAAICPKTCENFEGLCAGAGKLKYKGSQFHRVVPGGWVQGGDIVSGKGDSGKSIFGDSFADESFSVQFDRPGILAMASKGAHTNNSQFFVTTAALPWLNTKSVAFGRVVKGFEMVKKIESQECANERPTVLCKIEKAGKVDLSSTYDLKF